MDSKRILVVEDEAVSAMELKATLRELGYEVLGIVKNGEEAVRRAGELLPDLILMDIALPEMDGIQALKAIRKDASLQNIAVIALTASAMTSDRESILAYGFDGYIPKPIDQAEFMHTIQQVLYGKE